jgi:hypothetical protein
VKVLVHQQTTETYDGTSWTTSTSFNSARTAAASASASPASAGVMFGGNPAPGRTASRRMDRCSSSNTVTITAS